MTFRDTIRRTECTCEACQVGCKTMPGMLAIGDFEKIAAYANPHDTHQFMLDSFVASEGAVVAKFTDRGLERFTVGTITPAQKENGECVFYSSGKCLIHPVSPLGCSCVDVHQTRQEGDSIIHPALLEIAADIVVHGPYTRQRADLAASGKVARPRAERRAAFERLYAQWAARTAPGRPEPGLEA